MTFTMFHSTSPIGESAPPNEADKAAAAQLQDPFDAYIELFGDAQLQLLAGNMVEQVGAPDAGTFANSEHANHASSQMLQAHASPAQTAIVEPLAAAVPQALPPVPRQAPRPMNCWIIFRDAMHKQLKKDCPELTVQQISTRCSEIWHGLTPIQKQPWQAAAQSAKEEHIRQHPDYKYSPRKPGQKKKRQSRKAKQLAASVAADIGAFSFHVADTVPTIPDSNLLAHNPEPVLAANHDFGFADDAMQIPQATGLWESPVHTSPPLNIENGFEIFRQEDIAAELTEVLDIDTDFTFLDELGFAFRSGADGNATLPSFYSEDY